MNKGTEKKKSKSQKFSAFKKALEEKRKDQEERILLLFHKICKEFNINQLGSTLYISGSYIEKQNKGKGQSDFNKKNISKNPVDVVHNMSMAREEKYDLVLNSNLNHDTFGLQKSWEIYKGNKINILARNSWIMIFQSLTLLREEGKSLVIVDPPFWEATIGRNFRKELNKKGLYSNAIFYIPPRVIMENRFGNYYVILFSKEKHDKTFLCCIEKTFNFKQIAENYNKGNSTNIYEGIFIDENEFKGFDRFQAEKEFQILVKQYTKYHRLNFKDLVRESRTKDFKKDKDSIYIARRKNLRAVDYEDINDERGPGEFPPQYLQLILNRSKVNPFYLKIFLNSGIGFKFLNSFATGSFEKFLLLEELLNSEIYILPLELQNKTTEIMGNINMLRDRLLDFENNVFINPDSSASVTLEVNKVLHSLETLSEEEQLLSLIRSGETQHVEFKKTLSRNVETKQKDKDIEKMVLKTICGFLNTDGGTLFVGVDDSGDIYGIDKDIHPNNDKYLLHFRNLLKDQIGDEFFTLVDYEIKKLLNKDVLVVKCISSKKPVFLGQEEIFYIRSNPATDELKGRELIEYINNHFDNKE